MVSARIGLAQINDGFAALKAGGVARNVIVFASYTCSASALALVCRRRAAFAAHAADIYVWTDDSGKTHLADSVPRSTASRRADRFEPVRADARAAARGRGRARGAREEGERVSAPSRPRTAPSRAPRRRAAGRDRAAVGERMRRLQREYRESLECFAPYVNANGSLKPGASQACRSIVNPTQKCGSPKSY
jgi:hypothetical protein